MKHKNDASLSKNGAPKMTAQNTNMHKLMKMGHKPKFEVSVKKTPARNSNGFSKVWGPSMAKFAREAMEKPAGRDAFAYGRAVGIHAGLEQAKIVLVEMIDEREKKDFDL